MQDQYEVEQKFVATDSSDLEHRLQHLGAAATGTRTQRDQYFNHPQRDFAETDEALRLRTVGEQTVVTYKGPKLGGKTKTRQEMEFPLAADTAAQWETLLQKLSFRPVAVVCKSRRTFELQYQGRLIEVAMDEVEGLGTFLELETLADQSEIGPAQQVILNLADELKLGEPEKRSYLEITLAQSSSSST